MKEKRGRGILSEGKKMCIRDRIDFAGSDPITDQLFEKTFRHCNRHIPFFGGVIILPVLKMMAVSAFVVHPCQRISEFQALRLVRAFTAVGIIPFSYTHLDVYKRQTSTFLSLP